MMVPDQASADAPGDLRGLAHVLPVRIYFEDTDASGIVYNANYLMFAERARTEMLRRIGVTHPTMIRQHGRAFAVRRCEADFVKPARLDDLLEVHSRLRDLRGASVVLDQDIVRAGDVLVRMRFTLACMANDGRAARIPRGIRDALAGFVIAGSGNGTTG